MFPPDTITTTLYLRHLNEGSLITVIDLVVDLVLTSRSVAVQLHSLVERGLGSLVERFSLCLQVWWGLGDQDDCQIESTGFGFLEVGFYDTCGLC